MKVIKIRDFHYSKAERLAHERAGPKTELGLDTQRVWGGSAVEDDILGLLGEIAVGEFLGEDINEWASLSGDAGEDLFISNLLSVEVKTGRRRGYRFALSGTDFSDFQADIGILAWKLEGKEIGLSGWTTRVHFLKNCEIMDFGFGDRLAIEPENLLDMDLLEEVRSNIKNLTGINNGWTGKGFKT